MKFLFVSGLYPTPESPGYGSFVKRQADALRALGHQVEVVANTDRRTGTLPALRKYASLYARARKAAAQGSYDLVVGHFLYPNAGIARAAARIAQTPYVVVAHGTDVASLARADFLAAWSRQACEQADGVVAVSRALLRQLEEAVTLREQTPRAVINMGIDTSVFHPRPRAQSRATLGLEDKARVVVVVGNLATVKGPDRALEACRPLLESGALDRLVFVGDGELRGMLEQAAAAAGLSGQVVFAGHCEPEVVATWLTAADLMLLASRNEGLGLVILEAQACGTPVAAARVGGVPEVLAPEPAGYQLDPLDVSSWTGVISSMLTQRESDPGSPREARRAQTNATANSAAQRAREFAEFSYQVINRDLSKTDSLL